MGNDQTGIVCMKQSITQVMNYYLHTFNCYARQKCAPKNVLFTCLTVASLTFGLSGCLDKESKEETPRPYAEELNHDNEIAIALGKLNPKQRLLIVFGANWCPSCRRLDASLTAPEISDYLKTHFIIIKVNIGNFDKNLHIADRFGLQIKQGIPAIVIVNKNETVSAYIKTRELSVLHKKGRAVLYKHLKNI